MAIIRQKGPEQWHAQVRRRGGPPITAAFIISVFSGAITQSRY